MGKFLDQAGLNYLWSKLKTKLDGKVSKSGDTMTGDLKIQKTIPEFGLNSGNGRTRIFKNANAEADYGSSFGDILADEKTSVYLELHADSEPAGIAKLKRADSTGTSKEYKLFHEGNPDPGSAKSDYGMLSVPDILAWAGEQIRSGSFAVAKNTTTTNLPVANTYYIGFLDVTANAAARRIMLTNRVTGDTFVNATYNNAWIGWKQVSASDKQTVAWGDVSGKPKTFPPAEHSHDTKYLRIDGDTEQYQANVGAKSISFYGGNEATNFYQGGFAATDGFVVTHVNPSISKYGSMLDVGRGRASMVVADLESSDDPAVEFRMEEDRAYFNVNNENVRSTIGVYQDGVVLSWGGLTGQSLMQFDKDGIVGMTVDASSDGEPITTQFKFDSKGLHTSIVPTEDDNVVNLLALNNAIAANRPKQVTIVLPAASWSDAKTQTVTVSGVLADETAQLIQPVPAIASQAAYIDAGIRCIGQAAGQLTFSYDKAPAADLTVYIVITPLPPKSKPLPVPQTLKLPSNIPASLTLERS